MKLVRTGHGLVNKNAEFIEWFCGDEFIKSRCRGQNLVFSEKGISGSVSLYGERVGKAERGPAAGAVFEVNSCYHNTISSRKAKRMFMKANKK